MGLVSMIFKLPLAPVRGLISIAEIIRDQAEEELNSPMAIQRQLEEIERARAAGLMSDEDVAAAEQAILNRVTVQRPVQ